MSDEFEWHILSMIRAQKDSKDFSKSRRSVGRICLAAGRYSDFTQDDFVLIVRSIYCITLLETCNNANTPRDHQYTAMQAPLMAEYPPETYRSSSRPRLPFES